MIYIPMSQSKKEKKNVIHFLNLASFFKWGAGAKKDKRSSASHITNEWQAKSGTWGFSDFHLPASYTRMLISSST